MGRWVTRSQQWYETNVVNCSLCGKMIPSRMWIAEIDGQERVFCNQDCESLHHNYWKPKYGQKAEPTPGPCRQP